VGEFPKHCNRYFNLVRAGIGPGCLSLPYAFAQAGSILAPSLLVVLTLIV
jgi:amino acid permease